MRSAAASGEGLLVRSFPEPGPSIRLAYRELYLADQGTTAQQHVIGDPRLLPRPWEPATCTEPGLREQLWDWLDRVVTWVNGEYVWDVSHAVVSCWPAHPDLVHEVAVLADRRYRCSLAIAGDLLDEWHRYCLPTFLERARQRARSHCDNGHQPRPSRGLLAEHVSEGSRSDRAQRFLKDTEAAAAQHDAAGPSLTRLGTVDLDTGVVVEDF